MSKSDLHNEEVLSALMDGEVSEMELHRALKSVAENDDARAKWHRYHLASAALNKQLPDQIVDLSSSISAAIALEDQPASMQRWLKPMGRFAVAASVALVAVFGVQQYNQPQTGVSVASVASSDVEAIPVQLPSGFSLPQLALRNVSATRGGNYEPRSVTIKQVMPDAAAQEEVQRYLNELMLRHTENAALNTNQGMLPFARMPQIQGQP